MLKEKLSKILNISTKIISLKFSNEILENSKLIKDYSICENSDIIFGVNIFILEQTNTENAKFVINNKFIDQNISIPDLIQSYCNDKQLTYDFVKFEYDNAVLSNENVIDLIKTSVNPIFKVTYAIKICFIEKTKNVIETHLFPNETILELRNKLKLKTDRFHGNEILLYENKILEDHNLLKFYGIKDYCKVFSGFYLLVKSDDVDLISPVCVHCDTKIIDIRNRFANSLRIEWCFINLLKGEEKLDNSKTISDYEIDEMVCIDLKIGIDILIFVIDEVIVYLVKPDSTFKNIMQYISFKFKIDLAHIKMMVGDKEVKLGDNLVEMAKTISDLVISLKPKISINIKLENGEKILYSVWEKMKIVDFKELISTNSRTLKESIVLQLGSEELKDDKTIDFYKISENSEIEMFIQDRISIIGEDGDLHCVIIEPIDSIKALKQMLSLKIKKPFSEIHLYQDGIYLENSQTICFYEVNFNSLLQLKLGTRIRLVNEMNIPYELILPKTSTISYLKNLLYIECKLEMDKLALFFGNVELSDNLLISNIDLDDNSFIKIVTQKKIVSHDFVTFYVCNLTDNFNDFSIVSIKIKSDQIVRNIKENVFKNRDIDLDAFVVSFLGEKLDDESQLYQCGIKENYAVMLKSKNQCVCAASPLGIVVNVKRVSTCEAESKISKYLIDDYQSILTLKQKLRDELNVSIDSISLIFQGKNLNNNDSFRSLDIDNDSTIMMVIKNQSNPEGEEIIKIKVKISLLSDEIGERFEERKIYKTHKISTLKQQIADELNLRSNSFVLTFNEEIMMEKNLPGSYGLTDESEVVVCHSVLVKQFSGQNFDTATVRRFPIEPMDTVQNLKERIARKQNIQISFIKLNFQGEDLNENSLLRDVEVENESFLMMVTTLRGGAK